MRGWGFRLQLAVLAASLVFILAMLAAYATVSFRYLEGEGVNSHRQQLAHVAAALRVRALPKRLGWLRHEARGTRESGPSTAGYRPSVKINRSLPIAGGREPTAFPRSWTAPERAPQGVHMPPASLAGLYRAADQSLLVVWYPRRRAPPPNQFGPPNLPQPPPPPGPPPGFLPPREREALTRLCEQAVRQQRPFSEFRTSLRDAFWFYAEPVLVGNSHAGAVWCSQRISEAPIRDLSVWALPATIAAALLGISLALWTALNLQRSITTIQAGLALGREMVASLMPVGCLDVPGYEIARCLEPATEVGGDFYNLFRVGDHGVGLVLGDIAGTGVAAALYMAVVTTLIEEHASAGLSPAAVMERVNARLQQRLRARRIFATAVYALLDPDQHRVTLCSAGQTPCVWLRAAGAADYVKNPGTPLGRIGPVAYQEQMLRLEVGDTLVFATDGLLEVGNGKRGPLGYEGWLELVQQYRAYPPEEMVARLFAAVRSLPSIHGARDDMTLLVLRRNR